jgi:antitoxin (DNA-binding transcriptional repressor) of toxin-antitoxin stability system
MFKTITVEEAQAQLAELITGLTPGQEIFITSNDQPVADIRPLPM